MLPSVNVGILPKHVEYHVSYFLLSSFLHKQIIYFHNTYTSKLLVFKPLKTQFI